MNSLTIGTTTFILDRPYKDGAMAARNGDLLSSSSTVQGDDRVSWTQGFQNELRYAHVVDGVDIVSRLGHSENFAVSEIPTECLKPKATQLSYYRNLMVASGMYNDASDQMTANVGISPAALRRHLQQQGHTLTTEFANLLIRRIRLDWQMEGEALTPSQSHALTRLTNFKRQILLALAELQDTYFDTAVPNSMLARRFRQRSSWPNAAGSNFKREGLGFLVTFSGTFCTLTTKGWTVVNDLRTDLIREAAAQEDQDNLTLKS